MTDEPPHAAPDPTSSPTPTDAQGTDDAALLEEAAWEHEIAALLGGLAPVDPPEGAIASALDHRPLFAGRMLVGAAACLLVVGFALAATGALSTEVVPQVDRMTSTHGAAEAGLLSSVLPGGGDDVVFEIVDTDSDAGPQELWALEGRPVSMFREWGRVDFSSLDEAGRFELAGHEAWFDGTDVVVAQIGGNAVTFVGVDPDAAAVLLGEVEVGDPGVVGRALSRLDDLTAGLGFVEVD